MDYEVEKLPTPCHVLAKGAHWDVCSQNLYYNDVVEGTIHRYCIFENKIYSARVGTESHVTFIIPIADRRNHFLVGTIKRIGIIEWNGVEPTVQINEVVSEIDKCKRSAFNSGSADPTGRLYTGTMLPGIEGGDSLVDRVGSLYKFSFDNKLEEIRQNIGISNCCVFNEEKSKMYYIDTADRDIKEFDWNKETGEISNERVLIDFKQNESTQHYLPLEMTIDINGNLFIAIFGASKVIKVNTTNRRVEMELEFPNYQVTSVVFGGSNLDILFVTTTTFTTNFRNPVCKENGTVLKITGLGTKGRKMVSVKI